jgi:DNA-binding CsgD family transcriptional regulator
MGRRDDRWAPPPRGEKPPTTPIGAIDLYPNPQPPPRPPETRETILADLHAGFAALTQDELKVAKLWIYGRSVSDMCYFLQLRAKVVRRLWKSMRRKMRNALILGAAGMDRPQPVPQGSQPNTGTHQESGDTSPA